MSNLLEYKDYLGTVEYSSSDKVLYGKVIGINGLVSYAVSYTHLTLPTNREV